MSKGFLITEEKPDREYFTIVPNYIVNHSTIWEQGIYLTMKRFAGEERTCFASQGTIAERLKISRPTVSKTIKKLIKRGWVKETGKKIGKTQSIKEYLIVDLWKANMDFYRSTKPQNSLSRQKLSTTEQLSCKPQNIEEETYGRRIISNTNKEFGNSQVNFLLEEFKKRWGEPVDNKPRQAAWHIVRTIQSNIKKRGFDLKDEDRFRKVSLKLFEWLELQEWSEKIQTLSTIRRHSRRFFNPKT